MNTWGYLFLIAVLVLLAGAMLYARFSGRSREKSLHHAPADLLFSTTRVDEGEGLGGPSEEEAPIAEERPVAERAISEPVRVEMAPRVEFAPVAAASTQDLEKERRERDYFDELQEAAAGLAKLMRSSPVERPEPVVFAPFEVEEQVASVEVEEEVLAESVETTEGVEGPTEIEIEAEQVPEIEAEQVPEIEAEQVPEIEAEQVPEIEAEQVPEIEAEQVPEIEAEQVPEIEAEQVPEAEAEAEAEAEQVPEAEVELRVLSPRELLGEGVFAKFDQIDEGLAALDSLVGSIEASLRLLREGEFDSQAVPERSEPALEVPEAA